MDLRAWWAAAAPAAPVVVLCLLVATGAALVVDGMQGPLSFAAGALLVSAVLHGAFEGPLRGTPTQNLARVVLVAVAGLGVLTIVGLAFLTWLLSGLCGSDCSDRPWRTDGLLVALGFAVAAVLVAVGGWWLWRGIGRARPADQRTSRVITVLPALVVGAVAAVTAIADAADDPVRLRTTGDVRVLQAACADGRPLRGCGPPETLRAAVSGTAVLALWRTPTAVRGAVVGTDDRVRRVVLADGLPSTDDVPASVAVAADRDGGFVAAWTTADAVRFARVSASGRTRPIEAEGPGLGERPGLELTATATGFVAFAVDRRRAFRAAGSSSGAGRSYGSGAGRSYGSGAAPSSASGADGSSASAPERSSSAPTRLRALVLDRDLRARGGWRTVLTPSPTGIGPAGATADGRAAVSVGTGGFRITASVDPDGGTPRIRRERVLAPGPDAARIGTLPGPGDVPSVRRPPQFEEVAIDRGGRSRSLWTARAPRSEDVPARVRQQWLLGTDGGTPDRPLAEGLLEPRLLPLGAGVVVVGLRPTGPGSGADAEVVLVRTD